MVKNFIDSNKVDILNGCVRIAQLLSQKDENDLEERTISGGTLMIDIPVNNFTKGNVNFSSGANVLDLISQQIKNMLVMNTLSCWGCFNPNHTKWGREAVYSLG